MKKMNIPLMATLLVLSIIVCPILYFTLGPTLDPVQLETLKVLSVVAAFSAAFCFIVGEATGNNSQMDKLWSLLPIVYTWVIAVKGGMNIRLVVMAVLATLWGIRLTINFARKGAYIHLIIKDSIPLAFGGGAAIPTISVNSAFGLPSTCSPSVRAWALSIGA